MQLVQCEVQPFRMRLLVNYVFVADHNRKQIAGLPAANSTETLNLLTALLMGSPEFQLR